MLELLADFLIDFKIVPEDGKDRVAFIRSKNCIDADVA